MGHDHAHGLSAGGTATGQHRRRLVVVVGVTLAAVVVQVIGAALSGSLALLADAGHMLSDAAGVGIALIAAWLATRPASKRRTYGLQRAEVLAALANALILMIIAVLIFVEAIQRLGESPDIATTPMLFAAAVGAAANLVSLLVLHSARGESLNLRGAYLEVLGDLLGSMAVIAAAVAILTTGFQQADAIASMAVSVMIFPRAWSLLKEVIDVLLEAVPHDIDIDELRRHILSVEGVLDTHDLHIWTITSGVPVCSAHVVVADETFDAEGIDRVLDHLTACLGEHFDTAHCTFQVEPQSHAVHEATYHH